MNNNLNYLKRQSSFSTQNIVLFLILFFFLSIICLLKASIFAVIGFVIWTLFEYFLHIYIFHIQSENKHIQKFQFIIHGHHHQNPKSHIDLLINLPIALGLAVWSLYNLYLGYNVSLILLGFSLGYLYFLFIHEALHNKMFFRHFKFLRLHHNYHHYKNSKEAFGITTNFWDNVFKTKTKD